MNTYQNFEPLYGLVKLNASGRTDSKEPNIDELYMFDIDVNVKVIPESGSAVPAGWVAAFPKFGPIFWAEVKIWARPN